MGRKCIDLTGQKFGKLTVIEQAKSHIEPNGHKRACWKCVCDCGTFVIVQSCDLKRGNTKSCGCLHKEIITKHGMASTKMYREWQDMKKRCMNEKKANYHRYGGRQDHKVIVCDRWLNDFQAFCDDVAKLPHFNENGYSLDRINNDGDYEPNNVRWTTAKEQANNKSTNREITYNNKTQTLTCWADESGLKATTLAYRLNNEWDLEKALTTPVRQYNRKNTNTP